MDTQTMIAQLTSLAGQRQNEADALNQAIKVLTDGYQTDQDAISKGIADGVAAAVAPIQSAIATATATLASALPANTAMPAEMAKPEVQ